MNPNIDFKGFIQVGIVVKDIEKSARAWADYFGVPVPEIQIQEKGTVEGMFVRGKPAEFGRKKVVIDAGGWVVELFQPTGGDSTFQEFLDKHGEGVHHLGFEVGEKRDAIVNELEKRGCPPRLVGINKSWTVVDTEDRLGVNLNVKPNR
jgi:glyoxalase/bleomycin resistance protein/dioxygenase superfamily protein